MYDYISVKYEFVYVSSYCHDLRSHPADRQRPIGRLASRNQRQWIILPRKKSEGHLDGTGNDKWPHWGVLYVRRISRRIKKGLPLV